MALDSQLPILNPYSPTPDPPVRLFLTGFMGCGKSTAVHRVAARLGWTSIDLDRLTAVHAGRLLRELFAESEATFRAAEAETLARTLDRHRVVVATGGGTLLAPGAMERVKEVGRVVYLRLSAEALAARLDGDSVRPLLQENEKALQGEVLYRRVEKLLAARVARYEEADLTIDTEGKTPEAVARAIAEAAYGWGVSA